MTQPVHQINLSRIWQLSSESSDRPQQVDLADLRDASELPGMPIELTRPFNRPTNLSEVTIVQLAFENFPIRSRFQLNDNELAGHQESELIRYDVGNLLKPHNKIKIVVSNLFSEISQPIKVWIEIVS